MPVGPNKIGEPIDRKYSIRAVSHEHKTHHDENHVVVFGAWDAALPAALEAYRDECARLSVDFAQLEGIDLLIARVDAYQTLNPDTVKRPDVDTSLDAGRAVVVPNKFDGRA